MRWNRDLNLHFGGGLVVAPLVYWDRHLRWTYTGCLYAKFANFAFEPRVINAVDVRETALGRIRKK